MYIQALKRCIFEPLRFGTDEMEKMRRSFIVHNNSSPTNVGNIFRRVSSGQTPNSKLSKLRTSLSNEQKSDNESTIWVEYGMDEAKQVFTAVFYSQKKEQQV